MIRAIFPTAIFVEFPSAVRCGGIDQIGGMALQDEKGNEVGRIPPGTQCVLDYSPTSRIAKTTFTLPATYAESDQDDRDQSDVPELIAP